MSSFHWYQFYQYVRFAASFSYIQFYHICIKKCMLGYISLCKMQITVFANITCHLNNFIKMNMNRLMFTLNLSL